jgi:beta-galactosidase
MGVANGKEIEAAVLQTAGDAAKIKVTVDRKEITADGQDLSYVTVEVTDKDGILQPNAANRLNFKIEGVGTIAGVANADLKDTDPYVGNAHKAWKGRALVVIRSTHDTGNIKLTVSSDELSAAILNIKAISVKNK